jgi:hypothetical protein
VPTAKYIKRLQGWVSDARLYSLSEPIEWHTYNDEGEEETRTATHVVVSAVNAPYSGPETYIFPAMDTGKTLNMLELSGSFRGELNHALALKNAGYDIEGEN